MIVCAVTLLILAVMFWLAMRRRDRLYAEHRARMNARQAEHDERMRALYRSHGR